MDLTILSYLITKWALVYNLSLFFVWLIVVKRYGGYVSEVYLIVMSLIMARFYGVALGIRARSLRELGEHHHAYFDFMSGTWWDSRLAPEATVWLLLAVVLSKRFIKNFLFSDDEYRVKNGNRKSDK